MHWLCNGEAHISITLSCATKAVFLARFGKILVVEKRNLEHKYYIYCVILWLLASPRKNKCLPLRNKTIPLDMRMPLSSGDLTFVTAPIQNRLI